MDEKANSIRPALGECYKDTLFSLNKFSLKGGKGITVAVG